MKPNFINRGIDSFRSNADHIKYEPDQSPVEYVQKNISNIQDTIPNFQDNTRYSTDPGMTLAGYSAPNLTPGTSKAIMYSNGFNDIRAPDNPGVFERAFNPNYDMFEHPSESKIKDLLYKAHETYEANGANDQLMSGVHGIDPRSGTNALDLMNMNFNGNELSSHIGLGVLAREASLLNDLLQKYPNDPNVINAVQNIYSHRNKNGEYDVLSGVSNKDIGDINSESLPEILQKIKERESVHGGNNYDYNTEVLNGDHLVKSPVTSMDPDQLKSMTDESFFNYWGNNNPITAVKDAGYAFNGMFESTTLDKIDSYIEQSYMKATSKI